MYADPSISAGGKNPGQEKEANRVSTNVTSEGCLSFVNSRYSPSNRSTIPIEMSLYNVTSENSFVRNFLRGVVS